MIKTIITFLFISFILALGRIIPHPPNFTPILATAIYAPYLIKDKWVAMSLPLLAMFIADLWIGFHPYMLWVYGAIGLSTLISNLSMRFDKEYMQLGIMAILSSILFFIITNFAVWTMWDYYPKTIEGLIMCYTMAIPFFHNTLLSTIVYTSLIVLTVKKGMKYANNYI
jgi:hypothetical protein